MTPGETSSVWPPVSWQPGTVLCEVQAGFRGCVGNDDQVLAGAQAKGFSGICVSLTAHSSLGQFQ